VDTSDARDELTHQFETGFASLRDRCRVDVPALEPEHSLESQLQAVGRALRRDRSGSGVATILVPILLPVHVEQFQCSPEGHNDA
jgi:hypothetical protein